MIYPNIWGKDAIVAYSGLEGTTTFDDSVVGQLMGEHIGFVLDDGEAEFFLRLKGIIWYEEVSYDIVCSDLVEGNLTNGAVFKFMFKNQNTIVGYCTKELIKPVFHCDLSTEKKVFEGGKAYNTSKGWYAFTTKEIGDKIYFSASRNKDYDGAVNGANEGLSTDMDSLAEHYKDYFKIVPELKNATDEEKLTFAKCFSIMKSQVYTPDGIFTTRWTTPERTPHKKCWLWDSVFHSIGNIYIDPQLSYETLLAVLDMQYEDGFIPHMRFPSGKRSVVTQPPLLAWGLYKLYEKTGRLDWIENCYEKIKRHTEWVVKNRDKNNNNLYEWYVSYDDPTCHCGESGMDNSPRFDIARVLDAVDFSSFMANEMRHLEKMARLLKKDDEAEKFASLYKVIGDQINKYLYDEESGRYFDRDTETGKLMKISASSNLLPLFAGVCPPERAKRLVEDIMNPNTFGTKMPIPTVSIDDPEHSIDYWRGMVWINYCYMVQEGLRTNGYVEEANKIADATIAGVTYWYMRDGSIFEIYDPHSVLSPWELERKGKVLNPKDYFLRLAPVRDFGWSTTLYVAMIMDRENRNK